MDPRFWIDRWERGETAWHRAEPNPALVDHVDALAVAPGATVHVPLCGRSRDVAWLLARGFAVRGVELHEGAVSGLFEDLGVTPTITTPTAGVRSYAGPGLELHVGDVFDVGADVLGPVDAVYDRAALVALPTETRRAYATHLAAVTACAPQLLVTYAYDETVLEGPPFAIDGAELASLYGATHEATLLEARPVAEGLRGEDATELVWRLDPIR